MNEREERSGVDLADAESLLGMLQRGRGKGYLVALETPRQEVWPLLVECITNDPRSDEQWSPDEEYYASLILKTGMDLGPLLSFVRRNDTSDEQEWNCYYTLKTLRCLAHRGSRQALDFLREYIRFGYDFSQMAWIVHDLAELRALEDIHEVLYRRISSDPDTLAAFREEVEEVWRIMVFPPQCEPWKSLCAGHAGFAGLFARVGLAYNHPPAVRRATDADVADLSVAQLLSSVEKANLYPSRRAIMEKVSAEDEDRLLESLSSDNEYRVMLAFCGLGELGTVRAFDAVKSYIEASENAPWRARGRAFDAIKQMPGSLTLETARQWFSRDEWPLYTAASGILQHHATLEDVPRLRQALRTPEILRDEDSRLTCVLRALARFEGFGRIPELEQVFCQACNSFRRGDAAEAMAATSPDFFTAEYAYECLWDCDWSAFKIGCAMVDLSTPGAVERLGEIIADPYECEGRREVAKERLETAG